MSNDAPLVAGEVATLSPLVRRILAPNPSVMTGQGTNTYLVGAVEGDGPLAVIDPGPDDESHLDAIVEAGAGRIKWILVTHTHHDHWPGAAPLAARTGAEVLAFQARDGLEIDRRLIDGGRVVGEDFTLRALHTSGHAANHLCFLLEQERLLFTGDQVMHGSTVVLWPPDGDVRLYRASLERLLSHEPPLRALAPAHGHLFHSPAPVIHAIIDHRDGREARIVEALLALDGGPVTVDELLGGVYDDIEPGRLPIARGSLWAHLRKLVDDGRATTTGYDDLDGGRWTLTDDENSSGSATGDATDAPPQVTETEADEA
ncbi:MAG: MBL fold metallo-hydrolase [Solirubrobacteraceae bacterium]|nr:MBL fold metallo-hydrolase [Solirubrobacteraceae bacterium]